MFGTVLVANRGEIACRVIRTLRRLGIRSVAVYTDPDAAAPHVALADLAMHLGPAPAYLSVDAVVGAAWRAGAQAIHPGYGFLSENTAFAAACEAAGIVFVGPPSPAIEAMGDKIRAKQTVAKAGVPVVPGSDGSGLDDEALALAVAQIGYPVLLKPSAGGGGKGMREVHRAADLADAIASARREARSSFGDDTLLVERLVTDPRHIEIQVLADAHGNAIHLGERECSLQRRHQKIIEEAPSPLLNEAQRSAMGAAAVEAARAVGYVGAGTVEFIVGGDRPDEFFFMEMNTRLQVEHPVTEEIFGLDLVELQLRVAAGEPEPWPAQRRARGHAVEARIYAEDPAAGFLPTGGRVLSLSWPDGVRVDAGIAAGSVVGSDYDPMLAKVIAYGADRTEALARLDAALADTVVLGLGTNVGFLRALLADPDVQAGQLDTGLVGRRLPALTAASPPPDVLPAAAVLALAALEPAGAVVDPFDVPGGWRVGEPAWTAWRMTMDGSSVNSAGPVEVRARGRAADAVVAVGGAEPVRARVAGLARRAAGAGDRGRGDPRVRRRAGRGHAVAGPRRPGLGGPRAGPAGRGCRAGRRVGRAGGLAHAGHRDAGRSGRRPGRHRRPAPGRGRGDEDGARPDRPGRRHRARPARQAGRRRSQGRRPAGGRTRRTGGARVMDLTLSEEHEALRASVEDFARKQVAPVIGELYQRGEFPYEIVAKMGAMGLFGLPIAEEYGGMGGDYFALCLALEELARVDSSVAITLEAGVSLGAMPIYRFGTEEQKQRWLPALAAGEKLGAFGLTEPGGGSDAGATRTTARQDGKEWVINGSKEFITNSGTDITALVTVTALTGERQISAIIIPAGTPGFRVAPKYSKVGWCASDTRELFFHDVRVPAENLVGERGRGYAQFLSILDEGRVAIAALATGLAQGCVDESLRYAREREAFGHPIGHYQAIQFAIADMEARAHTARLAYYAAAAKMLHGEPFKKEAAIAKLVSSNAAMDNARAATQIFGGYGFMNDHAVGRFYRDAKILEIGEGTSEVQRMLIARQLGL